MDTKDLPNVKLLLEARGWLLQGAPSASKHHDAPKCVKTLLRLIDALPKHMDMYAYGTEEYRKSIEEKI